MSDYAIPEKDILKERIFEANPSARLQVDTARLREIVDFEEIKVARNSSIAKGNAMQGSDLDDGLVITTDVVSEKTQERFVQELKNQGFITYTTRQYLRAEEANEQSSTDLRRMKGKIINFFTREEIEKLAHRTFGKFGLNEDGVDLLIIVQVYKQGFSVK